MPKHTAKDSYVLEYTIIQEWYKIEVLTKRDDDS